MDYDISKLKFDINVRYDCDEGEDCNSYLEEGTYEEAVALFNDLQSRTWIDRYYHYMSIELTVYDENGSEIDLDEILDGEYGWIADYCTSTKTEASEMPAAGLPAAGLEFLEDLKNEKVEKKAAGRTCQEALEEIKNRLVYFCAKTDGTYSPSWAKELVEIADEGLGRKYSEH